ncbi:hypothetical protein C5B96_03270 [Subtercola sp. Z020]|nr:hypothetical protein C5B96_03270 [Subtercola sp. Z020]
MSAPDARASGISRRTLIGSTGAAAGAAAAWSIPALGALVAAPGAAASGGRQITLDFAALLLVLRHVGSLSVLVTITNNEPTEVSDVAVLTLGGIPTANVGLTFNSEATQYEAPENSNTADTPVENGRFALSTSGNGGFTLMSDGPLTLAAGETVSFFFDLFWHEENQTQGIFVILGHLTFGADTIAGPDDTVTIEPSPDPA